MAHRYLISRLTSAVPHCCYQRSLPVFRKDYIKEVLCQAIDEARKRFLLFAYVIMLDHLTPAYQQTNRCSEVLRVLKGKRLPTSSARAYGRDVRRRTNRCRWTRT